MARGVKRTINIKGWALQFYWTKLKIHNTVQMDKLRQYGKIFKFNEGKDNWLLFKWKIEKIHQIVKTLNEINIHEYNC